MNVLVHLGNGELQHEGHGLVEVPENLMIPFEEYFDSFEHLAELTFLEIQETSFDPDVFIE